MNEIFKSEELPNLFRTIVISRKSGLLVLKKGEIQKAVYFDRGNIVTAESNVKEESLGYRLLDLGMIDIENLKEGMKRVQPGQTLRAVLVQMGRFTELDLQDVLKRLVYEVVIACFDWPDGEYSFEEGEYFWGKDLCPEISTPTIIIEGVRRTYVFDPIIKDLLANPKKLVFAKNPPENSQTISLEPLEGFILSRIDGTLSAPEICAVSMISEEMTCRVLYGLLMAGILELEEPPAVKEKPRVTPVREVRAEPKQVKAENQKPKIVFLTQEQKDQIEDIKKKYELLEKLNHFAILEVAKGTPTSLLNASYDKLMEKYEPENNRFITDPVVLSKLGAVYKKLNEAYRTLTTNALRMDYDERLRKEEKEQRTEGKIRMEFLRTEKQMEVTGREQDAIVEYTKAKKFFETERYHDAVTHCKDAIKLNPAEPKSYNLLGKIQQKNPNLKWQKQAETNFLKAIELDPWNSEYVFDLGMLYKLAGMHLKARKYFIKTLELDERHSRALAEVPVSERPQPKRILETADKEKAEEDGVVDDKEEPPK
jgi:Flp pilus assembly protein TadD